MFELEEIKGNTANIKVVGVGGAGGNAVNNMIAANLKDIEFIAINTDLQVLESSIAPIKIQIGDSVTRGLGAGSNPQIGREAALEDIEKIREALNGADMVFITAGMGGGTGTGASPVIAEVSREIGALTVAVVTKPFFYEGKRRSTNAIEGIKELHQLVDTIITIPNDRIQLVVDKGTPLIKSFAVANEVLKQAVQGITDLILMPGLINLDFADVRAIMQNSGRAVMGVGMGTNGEGLMVAAKKAISNPLLEENSIDGARGVLINIKGDIDLSLDAVQEAVGLIFDSAHEEADIFFGTVIDPDANNEVNVTVIATGFEEKKDKMIVPETNRWKPEKKEAFVRGSERVLSKSLDSVSHPQGEIPKTEIMTYEDDVDTPTFMRQQELLK